MTVAIFDVGSPAYQTTALIGGTAVLIWSGTFTALAGISPAVTLRDVSIINTGANVLYIGGSSVTTAALYLPPGAQVTVQGWAGTSNTTTRDIYAIATSGAAASSTAAGLATLASVV
jgi:hypothetical protein